jgi:hypothetical protein
LFEIHSDGTEHKRHESELEFAQRKANEANEAKSGFLANVSHEIRTPLSAMLGCTELLLEEIHDEENRELLVVLRQQGRMLLGILNDVLDLSKIEAGRMDIHRQPCSIVEVVEEVCSLMEPLASEKGLALKADFGRRIPESIESDPLRLRQVLLNLVGNAVKFTESGGVTINVSCDASGPLTILQVDVADTGIGISREGIARIFEAFNQEGTESRVKSSGTGLGLTICRKLMQLLDGTLSVESTPGVGATFTIRIPAGRTNLINLVETQRAEVSASDDKAVHRIRCRVLAADDTRGIRFVMQRMLASAVSFIKVVGDGRQVVEEAMRAEKAGEPYDVVLMDMQMPILDGFDATRQLRGRGFKAPIVAITASAMQGERERCLAAGCDEYVSKPVDRLQMLALLRRLCKTDGATGDGA